MSDRRKDQPEQRKRRSAPGDLEQSVAEFARIMTGEGPDARVRRVGPRGEPLGSQARRAAVASLYSADAQDIQVVAPYREGEGIAELEREREIAKAALSRLKVKQLEHLSRDAGLPITGGRLALLDRLVTYFGTDQGSIAELIMRYADEESPARRHATRLVPTQEPANVEVVEDKLSEFVGQYLRTNVAEWFVFGDDVRRDHDELLISGALLKYEVEASSLLMGADDRYGFRTDERRDDVVVRVHDGQSLLRIQCRADPEAKAATRAFSFATGLDRSRRLLPPSGDGESYLMQVSPQSAWLAATIRALVLAGPVDVEAVTAVTFERDRGRSTTHPGSPHIASSRFKGRHVLDTPEICSYLAEGQVLSAVAMTVRERDPHGAFHDVPCRIALEHDSVLVATHFGSGGPDLAGWVHRHLEDWMSSAMTAWPLPAEKTSDLIDRIRDRSAANSDDVRADIFVRPGHADAVDVYAVN